MSEVNRLLNHHTSYLYRLFQPIVDFPSTKEDDVLNLVGQHLKVKVTTPFLMANSVNDPNGCKNYYKDELAPLVDCLHLVSTIPLATTGIRDRQYYEGLIGQMMSTEVITTLAERDDYKQLATNPLIFASGMMGHGDDCVLFTAVALFVPSNPTPPPPFPQDNIESMRAKAHFLTDYTRQLRMILQQNQQLRLMN